MDSAAEGRRTAPFLVQQKQRIKSRNVGGGAASHWSTSLCCRFPDNREFRGNFCILSGKPALVAVSNSGFLRFLSANSLPDRTGSIDEMHLPAFQLILGGMNIRDAQIKD